MRWDTTQRHDDGVPITPEVAILLVKRGLCDTTDIEWLRTAGAHYHAATCSFTRAGVPADGTRPSRPTGGGGEAGAHA